MHVRTGFRLQVRVRFARGGVLAHGEAELREYAVPPGAEDRDLQ